MILETAPKEGPLNWAPEKKIILQRLETDESINNAPSEMGFPGLDCIFNVF